MPLHDLRFATEITEQPPYNTMSESEKHRHAAETAYEIAENYHKENASLAMTEYANAITHLENICSDDKKNYDYELLSDCYYNVGNFHVTQKNFTEASQAFENSLKAFGEIYAKSDAEADWQRRGLASLYHKLAGSKAQLDHTLDAIQAYKDGIQHLQDIKNKNDLDVYWLDQYTTSLDQLHLKQKNQSSSSQILAALEQNKMTLSPSENIAEIQKTSVTPSHKRKEPDVKSNDSYLTKIRKWIYPDHAAASAQSAAKEIHDPNLSPQISKPSGP